MATSQLRCPMLTQPDEIMREIRNKGVFASHTQSILENLKSSDFFIQFTSQLEKDVSEFVQGCEQPMDQSQIMRSTLDHITKLDCYSELNKYFMAQIEALDLQSDIQKAVEGSLEQVSINSFGQSKQEEASSALNERLRFETSQKLVQLMSSTKKVAVQNIDVLSEDQKTKELRKEEIKVDELISPSNLAKRKLAELLNSTTSPLQSKAKKKALAKTKSQSKRKEHSVDPKTHSIEPPANNTDPETTEFRTRNPVVWKTNPSFKGRIMASKINGKYIMVIVRKVKPTFYVVSDLLPDPGKETKVFKANNAIDLNPPDLNPIVGDKVFSRYSEDGFLTDNDICTTELYPGTIVQVKEKENTVTIQYEDGCFCTSPPGFYFIVKE